MIVAVLCFLLLHSSLIIADQEYLCHSFGFDITLDSLEESQIEDKAPPVTVNVILDLTKPSSEAGISYCGISALVKYFKSYDDCTDFMSASAIEAKLKCFYTFISSFEPALLTRMDEFYGSELLGSIIDSNYDKMIMEGGSSFYLNKLRTLLKLFELPHVQTVCETGYNLGHSAALAFIANPNMTVISFDMATHLSTVHSVVLLQEKFPMGKLIVNLGDSRKSVPDYFRSNEVVCDVVLVDGGHDGPVPLSDLTNLRNASRGAGGNEKVLNRITEFLEEIEEAAHSDQNSFTSVQEEVDEVRTIAVPDSFVKWDTLGKLATIDRDEYSEEVSHPTLVVMDDVHMPYVQYAWQQAFASDNSFLIPLLTIQDVYSPCPSLKSAASHADISTQRAAVHMVNAAVMEAHLTDEPNACLETETPLSFKTPHYHSFPGRADEVYDALKTSYAIGVFM